MTKVVDFPNGVKVEITENGFTVISRDGEKTEFNQFGQKI